MNRVYGGVSKLVVVLLGLIILGVSQTAKADSIANTAATDFGIVQADISHDPAFRFNPAAERDFNLATLNFDLGIWGHNDAYFQAAIGDLDATLNALGYSALPGGSTSVPEPSSLVLLGITASVLAGAFAVKLRKQEFQPAKI
jgi:hypothetical protein